jgi:hypothetical protein
MCYSAALQQSLICSGCLIFKSNCKSQSSVTFRTRFAVSSVDSAAFDTIKSRFSRSKHATTATNSTSENFTPKHTCGPSDHGYNVPCGGTDKVSAEPLESDRSTVKASTIEAKASSLGEYVRPARWG